MMTVGDGDCVLGMAPGSVPGGHHDPPQGQSHLGICSQLPPWGDETFPWKGQQGVKLLDAFQVLFPAGK